MLFSMIFLLTLLSCQKEKTSIVPAFYYWRTQLELSTYEAKTLDSLKIQKLYVKFFDVDWDPLTQAPVPLASLEWQQADFQRITIVPTIFITNRTLENTSPEDMSQLGQRLSKKITSLLQGHPISEIQLDCDWTTTTKEKFFEFLRQMKAQFPNTLLSCTIRLHQVKFSDETGIPPADRGMLMFYNMGEINNWETENSILDVQSAKSYLARLKDYPLKLDIALPIYSWGAIYRNEQLHKLVHQLQKQEIEDTTKYTLLAPNRYNLKTSTILRGHFLEPNDQIRIEGVQASALMESAKLIATHLPLEDRSVVFYHLQEQSLQQFPVGVLKEIVAFFE
jgi:hypothetical protein